MEQTMNSRFSILAVALVAILFAACGEKGPSEAEQLLADQLATAQADAEAARIEAWTQKARADSIEKAEADSAAQAQADSVAAHPCPPVFQADSLTGFFTLEGFRVFFAGHTCDPYKDYFAEDGTMSRPVSLLDQLHDDLSGLKRAWYLLPEAARKALLPQVMPLVARGVGAYASPRDIHRYLMDLDWERDIAPVNPDWYYSEKYGSTVQWSDDDNKPILLPGYGEVARLDLKYRIAWQHQGRETFEAAKRAFAAVVK